jgi:hypothetical protein
MDGSQFVNTQTQHVMARLRSLIDVITRWHLTPERLANDAAGRNLGRGRYPNIC